MSDTRVADELEIRNLVATYADAVLRLHKADWLQTWASDGEWSLLGDTSRGHAALVARLEVLTSGLEYVMQCMGGGIIRMGEGKAQGRWTITEHARMKEGSSLFTMGAYRDDYCQEDGAWRFARRRLQVFYMGPPDMSGRVMPVPDDLGDGLEG
ncbi:MAG: nuclear transport factor 2 family protein [Myxococcota bacterium]|nr:nuclear transport factor 2 family protein [Myxococcota bacterium]